MTNIITILETYQTEFLPLDLVFHSKKARQSRNNVALK